MRRRILGEQSLERVRRAPGAYVDGQWSEGSESSSSFRGAIQPLKPREVEQLPEGWRTGARWKLYSRAKLRVEDVEDGTSGDFVLWFDPIVERTRRLLVVGLSNYSTTPRSMRLLHFKYFLAEQAIDEETT